MDPVEAFFGGVVAVVIAIFIMMSDQTSAAQKGFLLTSGVFALLLWALPNLWFIWVVGIAGPLVAAGVAEKRKERP